MDQSNMLEGAHDLNGFMPSAEAGDGTRASQSGGSNGSVGGMQTKFGPTTITPDRAVEVSPVGSFSAEDLARGFKPIEVEATQAFDPDTTGEDPVGDPFAFGGFCGRPRGFAR